MPLLSTGFVIAGAYADKVRRVLFAQLRDRIKSGEIDNKTVAARAGELNRLLFEILVNKLKIDKGDVVRIRIEYDVRNGDIVWKLDTLRIEAFRRIPDEEVEKIVKESISKYEEILASEVTEEEKAWTEAREREVEREIQRRAEQARASVREPQFYTLEQLGVAIENARIHGETRTGEVIALLKDKRGENIGIATLEYLDGSTRLTAIIIPDKRAYRTTLTMDHPLTDVKENPHIIVEALKKAKFTEITREEAEEFIKTKLEELL